MPFKSKAQQRLFFAAALLSAGKWKGGKKPRITLAMAKRWAEETPNYKSLPEKVKKEALNKVLLKHRRK